MTKTPILNALAAAAYIAVVASLMFYGSQLMGPEHEETVLVPIAFLSLFVLSAATMGYLFFYQPVLMYLEGQKQQAIELFLKTIATFAVITGIILAVVFLLG